MLLGVAPQGALSYDECMSILIRLAALVLAILAASYWIPGIQVADLMTAIVVAFILGLLNLTVKPILFVLTLPLTIITFGLFAFILNALLLWFVGTIIDGFTVQGFVPAFLGSLLISIISWIAVRLTKGD